MAAPQDASERDWYSNETATFGDRLADAREALGMSADDLARRLGIKTQTLERWENDVSEPRANKLAMVAGLLNVSLRWLLTGEGDGLEAPSERTDIAPDVDEILSEMRLLQRDLVRAADRLGRLEKRLRVSNGATA